MTRWHLGVAAAMSLALMANGCSLVGGVDGDYVLSSGPGGAGGGTGGAGAGGATGGSGSAWIVDLAASTGGDVKLLDLAEVDAGMLVAVGGFEGTLTTDVGSPTSAGDMDIFVAWISSSDGQIVDLATFGGTGLDVAHAVAVHDGEVVVVGQSCGDAFADTVDCTGELQAFTARLGVDRGVRWHNYADGAGPDVARAVAIDATGRAFVAMEAYDPDFSPFCSTSQGGGGGADLWIVPYLANGACETARGRGSTNNDGFFDIALEPSGSFIATTGYHGGAVDTHLPSTFGAAAFVAVYNIGLIMQWGQSIDGNGDDEAYGVEIAGTDVLAVGRATADAMIDGTAVPANTQVGFAMRFDEMGTLLDSTVMCATSGCDADATGLAVVDDRVVVTGSFTGNSRVLGAGAAPLSAVGDRDGYRVRMDTDLSGNVVPSSFGGNPSDSVVVPGLVARLEGDFVAGSYAGALNIGDHAAPPCEGNACGFVAWMPK